MTKEIAGAIKEWQFSRMNTIEFIKSLGNEGLKIVLPRPGLNTFGKHFQEMINVQKAYMNAIKTGKMSFDIIDDNNSFDGDTCAEDLINEMEQLDNQLEQLISETEYSLEIGWDGGEKKTIPNHLCALSTHEIFHVGQLVGFCYSGNIKIPQTIMDSWALSPQE
jgi:uncharacterized damage-inducible protein DinB